MFQNEFRQKKEDSYLIADFAIVNNFKSSEGEKKNINHLFATIEKNLKNIGEGVSFNTTIQWLNMTRLDEIFDYIVNCGISFGGVWFQLVTDPHYLDPIYAPRFMKENASRT